MSSKLLITLLLIGLIENGFGTRSAKAENALSEVRIIEGIDQRRPTQNRQTIGRRYVWNFQNNPYTILMEIGVERYNSYSSKERYDIPKLVEEGTGTIANLTREFQRMIKARLSWSKQDRVDFVLSFVQSLPYTLDDVTTGYDDFRRYAVETLIEGGGDCEDTTILAGAILRGLGEQVALIDTPGHIALGVSGDFTGSAFDYNGTKYYYCETTGAGWTVGQLPASVGQRATVQPLTQTSLPPKPAPGPDTVGPTPTPQTPDPTTPPPTPTTPDPTVTPPKPRPAPREGNPVGVAIFVVFLLVGFGAPILYLLLRFFRQDDEEVGGTSDEDDDEFDSTTASSHGNLLDR